MTQVFNNAPATAIGPSFPFRGGRRPSLWRVSEGGVLLAALIMLSIPCFAAPAKDAVTLGAPLDGANSDIKETSLGDLIADAVLATGQADIAFVPADEIVLTTHFDAGSHSPSDISKSLHYAADESDSVVALKLTGAQVTRALDRSVSRVPMPFEGFLQVSGISFQFDASLHAGKRVGAVHFGTVDLDPLKTYRVAMPRAVANGSFGYFKVWDTSTNEDTFISMAKSVATYLAAHPALSPNTESRIVGK